MAWSSREIIEATGGKLEREGCKERFGEIVTHSTEVKKGSVFIALKGERLDGHRFIGDAVERGAACLVVHRPLRSAALAQAAVIRVPDTLRALGDLAHFRRRQYAVRVMAITGSNGKTTTKEMLAAIMEQGSMDGQPLRGKVLKTEGNFNNLVGLPLTLLRLRRKDRVAVIEMGTNRPGEIQRLAEIAGPDLAIITSVAAAHLEGLKNLAGVAQEKGALFNAVGRGGIIVVNLEDPWVRQLAKKHAGKKITYGKGGLIRAEGASLSADGLRFFLHAGKRRQRIRLHFMGRHNITNALGAAAMAHAAGIPLAAIRNGLERVQPLPLRMKLEKWSGIRIINDAYNANPASMGAAIRALCEAPGPGQKIAILGDMFELGKQTRAQHADLGREIARARIDRLYLLGAHASWVRNGALRGGMRQERVYVGKNHAGLAKHLRSQIGKGDWLLLKGSRAMAMEKVLQELKG